MIDATATGPAPEHQRGCHETKSEQERSGGARGAFAREAPDELSKAGDVSDTAQRRKRAGTIDKALAGVRFQLPFGQHDRRGHEWRRYIHAGGFFGARGELQVESKHGVRI